MKNETVDHLITCPTCGQEHEVTASEAIKLEMNWAVAAASSDLLNALNLFLPLATDAKCLQSVKWTQARDAARAAIALAEGRQS